MLFRSGTVSEEAMSFAQGMWMGQPSRINARVLWTEEPIDALHPEQIPDGGKAQDEDHENARVQNVWVGGSAVLAGESILELL